MRTTKETVITVEEDDSIRIEMEVDSCLKIQFNGRMILVKALNEDTEPLIEVTTFDGRLAILDKGFDSHEIPTLAKAPFPLFVSFGSGNAPVVRSDDEWSDEALSARAEKDPVWTLCGCKHTAQDHALDGKCSLCPCNHYDGHSVNPSN
jgi:hypothetical protein